MNKLSWSRKKSKVQESNLDFLHDVEMLYLLSDVGPSPEEIIHLCSVGRFIPFWILTNLKNNLFNKKNCMGNRQKEIFFNHINFRKLCGSWLINYQQSKKYPGSRKRNFVPFIWQKDCLPQSKTRIFDSKNNWSKHCGYFLILNDTSEMNVKNIFWLLRPQCFHASKIL